MKPHITVPVLVWIDVDEGIARAVRWLNQIKGVRTFASCQGILNEGGKEPYRPQVMIYAEGAALKAIQQYFDLGERGDGWLYVHPKPGIFDGETVQ
jgi:hypothetical protein